MTQANSKCVLRSLQYFGHSHRALRLATLDQCQVFLNARSEGGLAVKLYVLFIAEKNQMFLFLSSLCFVSHLVFLLYRIYVC